MSAFEIGIQVDNELNPPVPGVTEPLQRAAIATLRAEGVQADEASPATLTVLLTTAERIQEMNRRYRQVDKPTDVLSFPADRAVPGMGAYLGDVVLAVPVAQAQADSAGHDLLPELILLTVHGVLHLLGHDHVEPEEKEAMWAAQDGILEALDVAVRPPV